MHRRLFVLALAAASLVSLPAAAAPDAGIRRTGIDAGRAAYDTDWATLPAEPDPSASPSQAQRNLDDEGSATPTAPAAPAPETRTEPAAPSGPKDAVDETPRFSPEEKKQAREFLQAVWKVAERGQLDCEKAVDASTRRKLIAADFDSSDVVTHPKGYLALARCAEARGFFGLMGNLGLVLFKYGKKNAHPEILARAVLGLGSPDAAWKLLLLSEKDFPNDPDIAVTKAKVLCRVRQWSECHAQAEQTLTIAKGMRDKALREAIVNRALKYRARSNAHLGRLDAALSDADASEKVGGDSEDLEQVRSLALEAKSAGAVLDVEVESQMPLGTYHLVGKVKGVDPLVDVVITRLGAEPSRYRVEAEVTGVTGRFTKTVVAMPGREQRVSVHPPLLPSFDPGQVRAAREVQVDVSITALEGTGERVVFKKSTALTLQPRDFLPITRFTDKEENVIKSSVSEFIAAWATPNARSVDAFLKTAKQRAPGAAFAGEQAATVPQVMALYQELQARGVSYVMDPDMLTADGTFGQRTRLPSEVLASTNAQCLEGAILYATLFEAIGLQPLVVTVPGHAFVGWATSAHDGKYANSFLFLETTATHDATFEGAVNLGIGQYLKYKPLNAVTVLPIAELRRAGFTPQPYDN
ncbi:MAG: hypothetical protein QM765_51065 [Myxococcales bacterium]